MTGVKITALGEVTVMLAGKGTLEVAPNPDFESFSLNVDGWHFVGLPGEGVAVWAPPLFGGAD